MPSVSLLSLATALPPYRVTQSEAKAAGKAMFQGRAALFDRLSGVFDNALIDQRATVAPIEWYQQPHGWAERTALYVEATEALFEQAATKALAGAGLAESAIDGIVF
ncbi:MAG: type III polyketide synthase, partial [Sphingomicrobium sp.]